MRRKGRVSRYREHDATIKLHHQGFMQGWELTFWFLVRITRFLRAKERLTLLKELIAFFTLFCKERQEQIAFIALFKRATREIPSFTKSENSDEERFALLFLGLKKGKLSSLFA